jgi:hypothetical protein
MTFAMVFTDYLPTLALVSLGSSESLVGLHSGLRYGSQLLQLPTLRAVSRFSKRHILVWGHLAALLTALPLCLFGAIAGLGGGLAIGIVFTALVLTAAGISVSNAVWFPLLRGYVEADRIGSFFGMIRTGWHLVLIVFYAGATFWLAGHEGAFGPLFAVAWVLGVLRIFMIVRLPERDERTGERIRARDGWALVRGDRLLRRYLQGVTASTAVRYAVVPFAIVMLRREVGFSSAEVLYATVAVFAGGLVSLYGWGRVVDRLGPEPVFRATALGMGALYLGLLAVEAPGPGVLFGVVAFFFLHSVLAAGHGVADTHVLFELTPPEAPARTLVIGGVTVSALSGLAPIATGFALDALLSQSERPIAIYHGFFALAALLQALSFLPLRVFSRARLGAA